jgi:hypothetical protein
MVSAPDLVVIGGGPAGLMASEIAAAAGLRVELYDAMPTLGRKFLMAGRGGLNLTHSEPLDAFIKRYGPRSVWLDRIVRSFGPDDLRAWAKGLGIETFVGSSGRVFPAGMKASPLLRAWLKRISDLGVRVHSRHKWTGWGDQGELTFKGPDGDEVHVAPRNTLLALGGASWPKLGSRGDWVPLLARRGVHVVPFRPSNCGINIAWTPMFAGRFAGASLHGANFSFAGQRVRGEATVTPYGLEGGAIYALSQRLRDAVEASGKATLHLDLRPEMTPARLVEKLSRPRAGDSTSNYLRKAISLDAVSVNLLREAYGAQFDLQPASLAAGLKSLPLEVTGVQSLARAISSAGGVDVSALDETLMLRDIPGVYVAGEMIDWEAPTGGYLLQACFATAVLAAKGIVARHGAGGKSG